MASNAGDGILRARGKDKKGGQQGQCSEPADRCHDGPPVPFWRSGQHGGRAGRCAQVCGGIPGNDDACARDERAQTDAQWPRRGQRVRGLRRSLL